MYDDLDASLIKTWDAPEQPDEFIASILDALKKISPDYVAFRDKFRWGHMDAGMTLYEWMDDMASYLHKGIGWDKLDIDAWVFGDMDGEQYGICKTSGNVLSVYVGSQSEICDEGSFEQFIRRKLG